MDSQESKVNKENEENPTENIAVVSASDISIAEKVKPETEKVPETDVKPEAEEIPETDDVFNKKEEIQDKSKSKEILWNFRKFVNFYQIRENFQPLLDSDEDHSRFAEALKLQAEAQAARLEGLKAMNKNRQRADIQARIDAKRRKNGLPASPKNSVTADAYSAAAIMAEAEAKAKFADIEARSKKANSLAALHKRLNSRQQLAFSKLPQLATSVSYLS